MKARAAVILAASLLIGADDPKDLAKQELAKFQGAWKMEHLEYNGKDMTSDARLQFRFVFKGDQATVEGTDAIKKEYARLTFKLDPTPTPKCMDLTVSAGVQKDAVMEGIYKLEGDELTLCGKVLGKDRPAMFAAPAGSSIFLLVLKRDKP